MTTPQIGVSVNQQRCRCGHLFVRHGAFQGALNGVGCPFCRCNDYRAATGPMPVLLEDHFYGATHYLPTRLDQPLCGTTIGMAGHTNISCVVSTRLPTCRSCRTLVWKESGMRHLLTP